METTTTAAPAFGLTTGKKVKLIIGAFVLIALATASGVLLAAQASK